MAPFTLALRDPSYREIVEAHIAELQRRCGQQWEDMRVNVGWKSDADCISSNVCDRGEVLTTCRTKDGRISHTVAPYTDTRRE